MSEVPTTQQAAPQGLINTALNARDKQMLQDVAHRLLAHGSLLRSRGSERALYDWSIEHQEWVEEWAALLGLKIIIQRDERLIMAIPEVPSMTRKLRRDETLVALALWYDYDIEVRENGAHEVFFNVKDFNESFQSKFPSLQPISASRLKEILRGFARFNLIETDWTDDFADSLIQILPTLRFAIPFPDIEAWLKVANTFNEQPVAADAAPVAEEQSENEEVEIGEDVEDSEADLPEAEAAIEDIPKVASEETSEETKSTAVEITTDDIDDEDEDEQDADKAK